MIENNEHISIWSKNSYDSFGELWAQLEKTNMKEI